MIEKELQLLFDAERDALASYAAAASVQGEFFRPVFGEGKLLNGVMFIGEAPGANETEAGRPFVGKAGKQLDSLLELAGINRDDIYITNTVKYRPVIRGEKTVKNRTPGKSEIERGMPLLREEIRLAKPLMVVTLGNVPLKTVLNLCGSEAATVGDVHGKPMAQRAGETDFVLFPCYHPASGIYNRSLVSVMEEDARILGEQYRLLLNH